MEGLVYAGLLLMTLGCAVVTSNAQVAGPVCDLVSNLCVNGVCESQADLTLGCTCYAGFIKDPVDPLVCHRIPACNLLPGMPNQQCLNGLCQMQMNGAFGCTCFPGFKISQANPNICENINECQLPWNECLPGYCTDLPGDYQCGACPQGKALNLQSKCVAAAQPTYPRPSAPAANNNQGNTQWNPWLWAMFGDGFMW